MDNQTKERILEIAAEIGSESSKAIQNKKAKEILNLVGIDRTAKVYDIPDVSDNYVVIAFTFGEQHSTKAYFTCTAGISPSNKNKAIVHVQVEDNRYDKNNNVFTIKSKDENGFYLYRNEWTINKAA